MMPSVLECQEGGDPYLSSLIEAYSEPVDLNLAGLLTRCMMHANVLERSGLKHSGEDIRKLVRMFV